ncbi:glutathione peroxidase [Granulicella tundricola]|uniref:glutathione peroxidase n=1 Tax=Granulicella tundricola TaxID=940615 RepID=UPI001E2DAA88|nr:glutathione peroxidase [Granulicella tundricola]
MACAVGMGSAAAVRAQEPANQDKTGRGATGHKKAAPDAVGLAPGEGRVGRGGKETQPEKVVYDYELPGADGKGVPLKEYKGKTLLIVNLARNSSYNSQVAALEKLNEKYKEKGLVVIGVPSNDFGAGEPGTDAEIQKVYKVDDKVTFPVVARSKVTGDDELPLYSYLTKEKAVPENGPVHWNYTKFLIDKNGKVVARFNPDVAPDSPEMLSTLDQVLDGRFKPKKAGGPGGPGGGGGDDGDPPA